LLVPVIGCPIPDGRYGRRIHYVVHSDNKRRARVNALSHILSKIPYEEPSRSNVKLPKRQEPGDYKDSDSPFRVIPEMF
jgi:hypothetical protein